MARRKLKRPDGWLHEEYNTTTAHLFENGKHATYVNDDGGGGEYTGKFWFEYLDGTCTRIYTKRTAPKWLLALYIDSTT